MVLVLFLLALAADGRAADDGVGRGVGTSEAEAGPLTAGLKYLSYYTYGPQHVSGYPPIHGKTYLIPGATGRERGVNVLTGSDLAAIGVIFDTHGVPSLYTPRGWHNCGNRSEPLSVNWKEIMFNASVHLRPYVANGSVVGIFYGDEISCTCGVPFEAIDAATSYLRGLLGETHHLIHVTNECMNTMGCPPPPARICPGCSPGCGVRNATHGFTGYWPTVPRALDFISADTYLPGAQEVAYVRDFYEGWIFPKLSPSQGVWVIPGLFAAIKPAASFNESLASSVNDTENVEKMQVISHGEMIIFD